MRFNLLSIKGSGLIMTFTFLLFTKICAQENCVQIDFESIPSDTLSDGKEISDEYFNSNGVTFKLEDGTLPHIAKVGTPITAFGTAEGGDTLVGENIIGTYFLTDDGQLSGLDASPLIVSFESPLDSISGVLLDIDFEETFTIQIRDQLDFVLLEKIITTEDLNTGDGIATNWGFKRSQPDIYSLRISGERQTSGHFGLGFDNLVFCPSDGISSIQNIPINQIKILPNPSSGNFRIELPLNSTLNSIELYDYLGVKVKHDIFLKEHILNIKCDYKGYILIRMVVNETMIIKRLILN